MIFRGEPVDVIDLLCPDECVESVLDIDLESLSQRGITALILDLDNTLLAWETDKIPPAVSRWIDRARDLGFKVCIASNGTKSRVRKIAGELGVPAIPKAIKPRKRPFRLAMEILGASPEKTAVIGDQVFTDVLGGNRLDLYTILINPVSKMELKTTRIVRRVEKRVLTRLQRKGRIEGDELELRLRR